MSPADCRGTSTAGVPTRCRGCGGDLAGYALSAWCRDCDPRYHVVRYCLELHREVRECLVALGKRRSLGQMPGGRQDRE